VILYVNGGRTEATDLSQKAAAFLEEHGVHCEVVVFENLTQRPDSLSQDIERARGADCAVSLGGDGTYLRVAQIAYGGDVPLLGVNFGKLGYLLDVAPTDFLGVLARVVDGDITPVDRWPLAYRLSGVHRSVGDGKDVASIEGVAFNEVVVEKTVPGHMVRLQTAIGGEEALTYNCDGVLVATALGSTGYNLSAGGPVLMPGMQALLFTPVAPHLTIDRSLLVTPRHPLLVTVLGPRPAVVVVDGQRVGEAAVGGTIETMLASRPLHVLSPGKRSFGAALRRIVSFEHE
jgi:NAD+ kinase